MRVFLVFVFFVSFCFGSGDLSRQEKLAKYQEYLKISMALYYEAHNKPEYSLELYRDLYKTFKKKEYAYKVLSTSSLVEKKNPNYNKNRLLPKKDSKKFKLINKISKLIKANKTKQALKELKRYTSLYPNAIDSYMSASLYYALHKDKEAIRYYTKYMDKFGCEQNVCEILAEIYRTQNNAKMFVDMIVKMYNSNKHLYSKKQRLEATDSVALAMATYNKTQAIEFIKKNNKDSKVLIVLYKQNNQIKKAIAAAKALYKKTKQIDILGTLAIMIYENAKNKEDVLEEVSGYFEKVVKKSKEHVYKNYYGYLLIDHDIDIKKGLKLVKQALKKDKLNMAYQDSLAWGYYKLGKCEKAYEAMNVVIKNESKNIKSKTAGMEVLLEHWDKIKKCVKKQNENYKK